MDVDVTIIIKSKSVDASRILSMIAALKSDTDISIGSSATVPNVPRNTVPHDISPQTEQDSKETEKVPAGPCSPDSSPAQVAHPEIVEVPKAKKKEKVAPKTPESPEPGRNKYGRWDQDMTPEIDAEIERLNIEGSTAREISGKRAAQGIMITWQRVRGRIAYMARKQRQKKAIPEITEEVDSEVTLETLDAALDRRIMEMYSRPTCKEISAELEREGIDLAPKEISQRVKEIQLRKIGEKVGQTIEKQVPTQANVAESIPAPIEETHPEPVQECAALQADGGPQKEDTPERFVTPSKISGTIWDLTNAGLTPKDISEHLNLKGLMWTEEMVERRLEKIKCGAA